MGLNSRYSQHARRALSQARMLAQDYQHESVDTDHLLVGILRERGSVGQRVLHDLSVDVRRAELEVRVTHAVSDPLAGSLAQTPALRRVMTLSAEESDWFTHHYIGTEHLLLALVRSGEGGIAGLMHVLGINADQVRRRVRRLLNDGLTELDIEAAKRMARLSELSRRVLNAAEQLANQRGDGKASLTHLLVVMARERRSPSSHLLREFGMVELDADTVLHDKDVMLAEALDDIIEAAVDLADRLGTHYTGTDHLLLALAEHPLGATLLAQQDVDLERLIARVYEDLR